MYHDHLRAVEALHKATCNAVTTGTVGPNDLTLQHIWHERSSLVEFNLVTSCCSGMHFR